MLEVIALKKRLKSKLEKLYEEIKTGKGNNGSNFFLEKIYEASKQNQIAYIPLNKITTSTFPNQMGYVKTDGGFIIAQKDDNFLLMRARTSYKIFGKADDKDGKSDKEKLQKNVAVIDKKIKAVKEYNDPKKLQEFLEKEMPLLKQAPLSKEEMINLFYDELMNTSDELRESFIAKYENRDDIQIGKNGKMTKKEFKKIPFFDFHYLCSTNEYYKNTQMAKLLDNYELQGSDVIFALKRGLEIDSNAINDDDIVYRKMFQEFEKEYEDIKNKAYDNLRALEVAKMLENAELRVDRIMEVTFTLSSIGRDIKKLIDKIEKSVPDPNKSQYPNLIKKIENLKDKAPLTYRDTDIIEPKEDIEPRFTKIVLKSEKELFSSENKNNALEALKKLNVRTKEVNVISNYGVFSPKEGEKKEKALNNLLLYAKSLMEQQQNESKQDKENRKEIQQQQTINIF